MPKTWRLECGIYLLHHSVKIFMEAPHSNNVKTEAALMVVQTQDIWKTSEDEQLTRAANITKEAPPPYTHTHAGDVYQKKTHLCAGVKCPYIEHKLLTARGHLRCQRTRKIMKIMSLPVNAVQMDCRQKLCHVPSILKRLH